MVAPQANLHSSSSVLSSGPCLDADAAADAQVFRDPGNLVVGGHLNAQLANLSVAWAAAAAGLAVWAVAWPTIWAAAKVWCRYGG